MEDFDGEMWMCRTRSPFSVAFLQGADCVAGRAASEDRVLIGSSLDGDSLQETIDRCLGGRGDGARERSDVCIGALRTSLILFMNNLSLPVPAFGWDPWPCEQTRLSIDMLYLTG